MKNGPLADGQYNWELTGSTSEMVPANPNGLDFGRGAAQRNFINKSTSESGTIRVINGSVVMPSNEVEAPFQPEAGGINEN